MIRFIYLPSSFFLFLFYQSFQLLPDTNGSYYGTPTGNFSSSNIPDGNTNLYSQTFPGDTNSPQGTISHHLQTLLGPNGESSSTNPNSVNNDNQLKQQKDMIYR